MKVIANKLTVSFAENHRNILEALRFAHKQWDRELWGSWSDEGDTISYTTFSGYGKYTIHLNGGDECVFEFEGRRRSFVGGCELFKVKLVFEEALYICGDIYVPVAGNYMGTAVVANFFGPATIYTSQPDTVGRIIKIKEPISLNDYVCYSQPSD